MSRYDFISLVVLIILVIAIPWYAVQETGRLDQAQQTLRRELVAEASEIYVGNCARCHGPAGEGLGAMPALNNPALVEADRSSLYQVIARAAHGTIMSAWHLEEGGVLNNYQIEALVALIQHGDWQAVDRLAVARGFVPPAGRDTAEQALVDLALARDMTALSLPVPADVTPLTAQAEAADPHECAACHEEPALHAERFGLNCARCHTLSAWTPALLTQHLFPLDHGNAGPIPCQTCHTDTYAAHTCYACHDHQPAEMKTVHVVEQIYDYDECVACHPTGRLTAEESKVWQDGTRAHPPAGTDTIPPLPDEQQPPGRTPVPVPTPLGNPVETEVSQSEYEFENTHLDLGDPVPPENDNNGLHAGEEAPGKQQGKEP